MHLNSGAKIWSSKRQVIYYQSVVWMTISFCSRHGARLEALSMPSPFKPVRYFCNSKMNHCANWFISTSPLFIYFSPLGYQTQGMFTKVCSSQWVLYFNFYLPSPMSQTKIPVEHLNSFTADSGINNCLEEKSDSRYYNHLFRFSLSSVALKMLIPY